MGQTRTAKRAHLRGVSANRPAAMGIDVVDLGGGNTRVRQSICDRPSLALDRWLSPAVSIRRNSPSGQLGPAVSAPGSGGLFRLDHDRSARLPEDETVPRLVKRTAGLPWGPREPLRAHRSDSLH